MAQGVAEEKNSTEQERGNRACIEQRRTDQMPKLCDDLKLHIVRHESDKHIKRITYENIMKILSKRCPCLMCFLKSKLARWMNAAAAELVGTYNYYTYPLMKKVSSFLHLSPSLLLM